MNILLLQIEANPLLTLAFIIIGILISVFIARWVFRINELHYLMKRQLEEMTATRIILGRIAKKEEITKDDIDKILSMTNQSNLR